MFCAWPHIFLLCSRNVIFQVHDWPSRHYRSPLPCDQIFRFANRLDISRFMSCSQETWILNLLCHCMSLLIGSASLSNYILHMHSCNVVPHQYIDCYFTWESKFFYTFERLWFSDSVVFSSPKFERSNEDGRLIVFSSTNQLKYALL